MLGVHEDTLRNWDKEGLVVADRIGKRRDRRYNGEHIKQIKEKGLVSNLTRRTNKMKNYEDYTKEQLIKELQILKQQKKFGLVWEEKTEEVVEQCKKQAPILESVPEMSVQTNKDDLNHIMIEGDNYHALQVLNYTHKGKIDVIYIDPPYNTGARDWKYNNDYVEKEDQYRHSKWLSMMNHRLRVTKNLLKEDGVLVCTIDENERPRVELLLEMVFSGYKITAVTIIHNPQGVQGNNFSYTHEYALFVFRDRKNTIDRVEVEERREALRDDTGNNYLRTNARNCFYPVIIESGKIIGFGEVPKDEFHPKDRVVQKNGYQEIWPIRDEVERKWRYARQSVEEILDDLFLRETKRGIDVFQIKRTGKPKTVWVDPKYHAGGKFGTKLIDDILGKKKFDYPKSLYSVLDVLKITTGKHSTILDFFAGSGTTAHAVLELNKQDGGNRQVIVCTNNENNNGNGSEGIARGVCQPRIKKVIQGYTKQNGKNEKVEGLGGNLKYFKTDFVDVKNIYDITDDDKLKLTEKVGQMIALKENAFEQVEKNAFYQIFTDQKEKFVGVYFSEDLEKLQEFEDKILEKPDVRLYLFSYEGSDEWKSDYEEYNNVQVQDIPEPILRVYRGLSG